MSSLSSSDENSEEAQAAGGNSDDSDVMIIPVKRKRNRDEIKGGKVMKIRKEKIMREVRSPGTGAVLREMPKKDGVSGSDWLGSEAPTHRKKLLQLKTRTMDGESAAVTRVKRRKSAKMDEREHEAKVDEQGLKTKMKMKMKEPSPMSGRSGASTRVKKRKVNEREMNMEPPLKRAKRQSGSGKDSRGGSALVGGAEPSKTKGKEKQRDTSNSSKKRGKPPKAKGITWPVKTKGGNGRHEVSRSFPFFGVAEY
jgi:hypothetical protein